MIIWGKKRKESGKKELGWLSKVTEIFVRLEVKQFFWWASCELVSHAEPGP